VKLTSSAIGMLASTGAFVLVLATGLACAADANTTSPMASSATNPCTGEIVSWQGTDHFVYNQSKDGNKYHVVFSDKETGQGVSNLGRKYNYGQDVHANFQGPLGMKFRVTIRLISQGSDPSVSGDNWFSTTHVIVAQDGTTKKDFAEDECRGGSGM